ncbi:acyl-CoA dehydrogenase family protein, partial [Streptomyces sp. UNOC14_S4]|uniref:acyl-CoA dehydrogenase family protein n=1 Tax=Streptomyces sp. UNOC14_S4 TaxID=2872340 RepID=UPI001E47E138
MGTADGPDDSEERARTGTERIADFARTEIAPYLAAHPEDAYPRPLVERLAQLGAFAATVPAEHGGAGWGRAGAARIGYELGRAWQPLAGLVGTHLKLCGQVLRHGTPEQRRTWLAPMARGETVFARAYHEQGVGHPARLRTRVTRRGGTGVLDGRKSWVTNARHADRVLAVARDGEATVGVFVDPARPGVTVGEELPRPGMLGVSLAEITFEGYEFDPDEDVLGGWGHDLTGSLLAPDVTGYVSRALGSADAVHAHAVDFVRATAGRRPAAVRGALRLRVGELTTRVTAMRAVRQSLLGPDAAVTSEAAKVFCTMNLQEVLREAVLLCGGAGYAGPETTLGRHYRDALALLIVGAPNDVLLYRVGERELG